MTDSNLTGKILGVIVFIFIILGGGLFVNSGLNNYNVGQTQILTEFENGSIRNDLNTLEINMQVADADSLASQSEQAGFVASVGKIIAQSKAIQNIIKVSVDISKGMTSGYIPSILWWVALLILGILILMDFIAVWTGRKS